MQAINPSGVDASVVLSGDDPEGACEFVFTPARLTLPAGVESQAKIKVKARSNFEGEGQKEYPFTISVTRVGELEPMATVQGRFQQKQLRPVTLTLIPPQLSSTGAASYIVRASNPRPRPVQVLLSAQDEADALAFTFKPSEINLSAGAEGSSTLNARPKDRLMKGEQRRVHKFVVTGSVDGAATAPTAKGTLAQIPGLDLTGPTGASLKLGLWFARWLAVLLILLFLVTQFLAGIEVVEKGCRVVLKWHPTCRFRRSMAGGMTWQLRISRSYCRNVRLVQAMLSVMPQKGISDVLSVSPFAGITRGLAGQILHFVNLASGKT